MRGRGIFITGRILTVCVVLAMFGFAKESRAGTVKIATCGEMKGYSYFWPSPFVPEKDSGFGEDGISSGQTTLAIIDGEPDVVFDKLGDPTTARLGGAEVSARTGGEIQEFIIFLVVYPEATIEIYTYSVSNQSMVMLQTKYGGLINKATMFKADCQSL